MAHRLLPRAPSPCWARTLLRLPCAHGRVHEYGGAAYTVDGGDLFFADFKTQQLLRHALAAPPGTPPVPLTLHKDASVRFADFVVDRPRGVLIGVCEDHREQSGGGGVCDPAAVKNSIVAVALDGSGSISILAEGHDFYACPRVSPDGQWLAWTSWDHPSMPWDDVELSLARLAPPSDGGGVAALGGPPCVVAGGVGESVDQPCFSPDSSAVFFLSDRTDKWNLYRVAVGEPGGGRPRPIEAVAPINAEVGGPKWQLGGSSFAFVGASTLAFSYHRPGAAVNELRLVSLGESASEAALPLVGGRTLHGGTLGLPASISRLRAVGDDGLCLLGGGPADAPAVHRLDGVGDLLAGGGGTDATVLRRPFDPSTLGFDLAGYLAVPTHLEFGTTLADGTATTAYANVYTPTNADFNHPLGTKPPLLVKIHGGPTSSARTTLQLSIQFWTSRGFVVADVNYGGSTGFGRAYRNRLKGAWGVVDVNDACNVAKHLADTGAVDPRMLCIDGGSAGGYTALACLAFRDTFTAAASHYGVADLAALARDTHKFESRYLDGLVAPYPEGEATYTARSPIEHVDGIRCPILLLQGDEDAIVPPNQATAMHKAVQAKGIPTKLLMFEGEQHGFRREENIVRALEAELFFYGRCFGFQPADEIEPFTIDNLPDGRSVL
jgi:dienelactone hydrolase